MFLGAVTAKCLCFGVCLHCQNLIMSGGLIRPVCLLAIFEH